MALPQTGVEARTALSVVKAHQQRLTLRLIENIPSHETRETDPYYSYFNAAKKKMKAMGLLKCWVCGTQEDVECHHTWVEHSAQNGYDWRKFALDHPEVVDEETFKKFVEGPDNITPLCRLHHTGILGIHFIPVPNWIGLKYEFDGLAPLAILDRSGDPHD